MAQIVVTHWVHPEVLDLLAQAGTVESNPATLTLPRAEIIRRTSNAEALLAFMPDCVDEEFLQACPNLKIVAGAFKGGDNIDAATCARRKIRFTVVPDLLTAPTAELAITLLLGLARRVLESDALVRSGQFQGWRPILFGAGLAGKRLGIYGFGRLGQAIAKRLAGFECELYYADPQPVSAEHLKSLPPLQRLDPEKLPAQCDALILAAPLTPQSIHYINHESLLRMPKHALLVNIGRGSVADELAVAEALTQGRLGGYAADVFEFEDLSLPERPRTIPSALLEQTGKTLFTPHLGSAVESVRKEIALEAARHIVAELRK